MSSKPASPNKLRTISEWIAISLALFIVIWIAVIAWWRATRRIVTATDTFLYLGALPLALLLCIGLFCWYLARRRNRAARSVDNAIAAGITGSLAEKSSETHARNFRLPILSAWAAASPALNAEELIKALAAKSTRPTPDDLLNDGNGFAVLSGRVKNLDTASVSQSLRQAISNGRLVDAPDAEDWRDGTVRALSLLDSVIDQALNNWPLSIDDPDASRAAQEAATSILRGSSGLPTLPSKSLRLRVILLVSDDLKPYEQQFAQIYTAERLSMLPFLEQRPTVELVPAHDNTIALALADEFNIHSRHDAAPQALFLLAGDSALCETVVAAWKTTGRLFDTRRPNGLMNGEAAFGVLFANQAAMQVVSATSLCHLTRVVAGKRDISADIHGKTSHVCLTDMIAAALQSADISGDAISTVICDADHRTNRALECIGAMMHHTPQLDAIQNRLATNEACGHLGAASVLGMLAAGAIHSHNADHQVLLFNVSHPTERAAAVLLPADDELAAMNPTQLQAA